MSALPELLGKINDPNVTDDSLIDYVKGLIRDPAAVHSASVADPLYVALQVLRTRKLTKRSHLRLVRKAASLLGRSDKSCRCNGANAAEVAGVPASALELSLSSTGRSSRRSGQSSRPSRSSKRSRGRSRQRSDRTDRHDRDRQRRNNDDDDKSPRRRSDRDNRQRRRDEDDDTDDQNDGKKDEGGEEESYTRVIDAPDGKRKFKACCEKELLHIYGHAVRRVYARWLRSPTNLDWPEYLATHTNREEKRRLLRYNNVVYLTKEEADEFTVHYDTRQGLVIDKQGRPFIGGRYMFVLDQAGERLYIGKKERGRFHHTSFVAGAPVQCAGFIQFNRGRITMLRLHSGHYKPGKEHAILVRNFLSRPDWLGPKEASKVKIYLFNEH